MSFAFRNKKIAVLGAGIEGKSAENFFKNQGAVVSVFDEKKAPFPNLSSYDIVVRSPGVKLSHPRLKELINKKRNITITSPTNIFFDLCPTKNIIGVTGTKGKGTTASLIYEILKKEGLNVYLGGNIGTPALDFLASLNNNSYVVLELSSFQLIDLHKNPHIAVVLMTTSEHLNWHEDMDEYIGAKSNIAKYQTENDFVVFNEDYKNSVKIAKKSRGKQMGFSLSHPPPLTESVKIGLPGRHNLENVYAAYSVGKILNIKERVMFDVIQKFKGLPNRLEFIKEVDNVKYYNDSFSSNPDATIAALQTFKENKIIIIGGFDRRLSLKKLTNHIAQNRSSIRKVVLIGQSTIRIKQALEKEKFYNFDLCTAKTMKEIVKHSRTLAYPGDLVILSPGFASFDMFKNFEERGIRFKQAVNNL